MDGLQTVRKMENKKKKELCQPGKVTGEAESVLRVERKC